MPPEAPMDSDMRTEVDSPPSATPEAMDMPPTPPPPPTD
jgi:hypothetical protein